MNWYHEWQALSARIQGLLDAGSFFYSAGQQNNSGDTIPGTPYLIVLTDPRILIN